MKNVPHKQKSNEFSFLKYQLTQNCERVLHEIDQEFPERNSPKIARFYLYWIVI